LADWRSASRLLVAAVTGATDIVETMHCNIARLSPIVGAPRPGRARGITGLVYRSVRGVTRAVGSGLDTALAQLEPLRSANGSSPRREATLAALNGVVGDYLVAADSPLAIPMRLRQRGRSPVQNYDAPAPQTDAASSGSKLLVLVHGLCMSDLGWEREGHDHGAALARDLGYTPLYLHYNSGRHVATNGREFAGVLERLVEEWPVPVSELVLVGHSMGGLGARSACHYAALAKHAWPGRLTKLVFLGTPHHGAPLERAGNRLNVLLGISPYTAPLTGLGGIRSAGVQDLRYGRIVETSREHDDEPGNESLHRGGTPVPLPEGVHCFAVAASRQRQPSAWPGRVRGDGLVPVRSALGQHQNPRSTLAIPPAHRYVCFGANHFDLLGSREVYERLRGWLTAS
jgi:hypothetical protein